MRSNRILIFVILSLFALQTESFSQAKKKVLIGVTYSKKGRYAEPSLMLKKGFELWVSDVNRRGGLKNRKVKLIAYDDRSDSELVTKLYERLILKDKVDFVFSPYSSPLTFNASKVTEKYRKVMLAVAAAAEKPWKVGVKYLFQVYAPAKRQYIGLLDMMAKKGKRSVSLIYGKKSVFNLDMIKGIEDWAKLFRIKILYKKGFFDSKKEFPDLLEKISEIDADALILSAYSPDCYELLSQLKKTGYRPKILSMPIAPIHPDFYKKAGKTANHIFAPSQWEPEERVPFPGTKSFIKRFYKKYGHMPSFHAASAYASCQLFESAVKNTDSLNHRKIRDYLSSLDTVTVLGRFKVDSSGMQIGHSSIIIQWQKGKKQIVWPFKMKTAAPVF